MHSLISTIVQVNIGRKAWHICHRSKDSPVNLELPELLWVHLNIEVWGLAASDWMRVAWVVTSLACLRMYRASPIDMTPSSFSINRTSIWRLSIVSFLSANFVTWVLAELLDKPASLKKRSQSSGVINPVGSTMSNL